MSAKSLVLVDGSAVSSAGEFSAVGESGVTEGSQTREIREKRRGKVFSAEGLGRRQYLSSNDQTATDRRNVVNDRHEPKPLNHITRLPTLPLFPIHHRSPRPHQPYISPHTARIYHYTRCSQQRGAHRRGQRRMGSSAEHSQGDQPRWSPQYAGGKNGRYGDCVGTSRCGPSASAPSRVCTSTCADVRADHVDVRTIRVDIRTIRVDVRTIHINVRAIHVDVGTLRVYVWVDVDVRIARLERTWAWERVRQECVEGASCDVGESVGGVDAGGRLGGSSAYCLVAELFYAAASRASTASGYSNVFEA